MIAKSFIKLKNIFYLKRMKTLQVVWNDDVRMSNFF